MKGGPEIQCSRYLMWKSIDFLWSEKKNGKDWGKCDSFLIPELCLFFSSPACVFYIYIYNSVFRKIVPMTHRLFLFKEDLWKMTLVEGNVTKFPWWSFSYIIPLGQGWLSLTQFPQRNEQLFDPKPHGSAKIYMAMLQTPGLCLPAPTFPSGSLAAQL